MTKRFAKQRRNNGFTLVEMLITVAIIAILIAVAVPRFSSLLERSREAADLANVRSAYAQVMMAAIGQDTSDPLYDPTLDCYAETVELEQKKDGWETNADTLNIGGIARSDSAHWKGDARAGGSCTVTYDNKSGETTLVWSGYSVYINYQWKNDGNGYLSISEGSVNERDWPASAVPYFISAKNNSGQKVVVDVIDDSYPALKSWLDKNGGFEIGISITDENGLELFDTGGRYISSENVREFAIETGEAADGANVKLAIQFFKMNSATNHNSGSTVMTEQEARELERIFTVTE